MDSIGRVEARLVLPRAAKPLSAYARFYAGVVQDGRPMVDAVLYAFGGKEPAGVHVVPEAELPNVMDGGCSVLRYSFDPATGVAGPVRCGGMA